MTISARTSGPQQSAPRRGGRWIYLLAAAVAFLAVPVLEFGVLPFNSPGVGSPVVGYLLYFGMLLRLGWSFLAAILAFAVIVLPRWRNGLATALALHPLAPFGIATLLGVTIQPLSAAVAAVVLAGAPWLAIRLFPGEILDKPVV